MRFIETKEYREMEGRGGDYREFNHGMMVSDVGLRYRDPRYGWLSWKSAFQISTKVLELQQPCKMLGVAVHKLAVLELCRDRWKNL